MASNSPISSKPANTDRVKPTLENVTVDSVTFWTDVTLFSQTGIRIAFSQRDGGVSPAPYATLNVGAHVGDETSHVQANRQKLCEAGGLSGTARRSINSARQVHGIRVANAVAAAVEHPDTDALITDQYDVALLLCFADCVPIIIVDPALHALAVVHSGWRGTLDRISLVAVDKLVETYGAAPSRMLAYIGPHIGLQNFTIAPDIAARFFDRFDICRERGYHENVDGRVNLDLGLLVGETLAKAGVPRCNIIDSQIDTVSSVDDFFSYRAEHRVTGRFGALGCLCSQS